MNIDTTTTLTIDCIPSGRNGTVTLTARIGDKTFTDTLNVTKAKAREDFTKHVAETWTAVNAADVMEELERIAAQLAAGKASVPVVGDELDASCIVRPERFITAEVSGLAVPLLGEIGGKVAGRWSLYLCWADGKRECHDLESFIPLHDDRKLWFHPQPSDPTPGMARALCGWSPMARRTWLDGDDGPDSAEVFERILTHIAYYLDLPNKQAPGITATLALWVMLTYCYPVFGAVPYLFITGALGSGKSRVFDVLARLVFRTLSSSNMTAPALFRTLHSQGGTLLLDEAERLKQKNDPAVGEISSLLLAGYRAGGQATRLEPIGDSFRSVSFDVFGPKALACIAGLPPALMSRCIPITMFRAAPGSPKPRRRINAEPAKWQALRDDLHALALNHGPTWLDLAQRTDVCPAMQGREFELWQPLLALAWWIDRCGARGLLKLVQEHALATLDDNRDDQVMEYDETLLRILVKEIRAGSAPRSVDLLNRAKEIAPDAFAKWTARGVSSHLKRYGLRTNKSMGRKVYDHITIDQLKRIQTNYSMDLEIDDIGQSVGL